MKESKGGHIESIPPECAPYYLLTPRERQVLQHTADGLTSAETAREMGISPKTVEKFKGQIGHIGTSNRMVSWYEGNIFRQVLLALIQDGIENGYVQHNLEETKIRPLSPREDEMLDEISQGLSSEEIAKSKWITINTVVTHMGHVNSKLGTKNFYHSVARRTYLKLHGQWKVVDWRGRRASNS